MAGESNKFHLLLRAATLTLCIAAMAVMLQSKQTNEYGALRYTNIAAFKYLVYANGICAGYSLFSALYFAIFAGIYSLTRAWLVFIFDQVLTYVILTAAASGIELLYLAYRGDEKAGWSEVCVSYDKFCYNSRASVLITIVAVVCFVLTSLLSAHGLFSKYEPPLPNHDLHDYSGN